MIFESTKGAALIAELRAREEDERMLIIEGQREQELLAEAYSEIRRRRAEEARCDQEISQASQTATEPAWKIALWANDWEVEKLFIAKGEKP